MTLDIVKHSALVTSAEDVAPAIDEALRLAVSGRPGPVWIDIPKDVLQGDVAPTARPFADRRRTRAGMRGPGAPHIPAVVERLRRARRPLLYSGGGVSRAGAESAFRDFASASGLPHVHSLNGIGNAGRAHAEDLGMLGMHGSKAANQAVDACDLLIVVGARLDDRATGRLDGFAPNAQLIHLDIDAAELNKRRRAELALQGELAPALSLLARALAEQPLAIAAWRRRCRDWRARDGFVAAMPADAERADRRAGVGACAVGCRAR